MKFTIEKTNLLTALNKCVPIAIGRSTNLPILECVKLDVSVAHEHPEDSAHIVIQANNLETAVSVETDCATIETSGTICAPAKRLMDVVRACPDGVIEFELSDETKRLKIQSGSAKFTVSCLDSSDWPVMPDVPGDAHTESYEPSSIADALENVAFAASNDDSRFNLCAINIEPIVTNDGTEDNDTIDVAGIRFTSTDGHRLARAELPINLAFPEGKKSALLPKTGAAHLVKLLRSTTDKIQLTLDSKNLLVALHGASASFRLMDGEYPNADRVIPQSLSVALTVKRTALLDAIGRANLFTSEKMQGVSVSVAAYMLAVASPNGDMGQGADTVKTDYDGEAVNFIINGQYLAEALRHIDAESVKLEFVDTTMDGTPIILSPVASGDGNGNAGESARGAYFSLVMPMRT